MKRPLQLAAIGVGNIWRNRHANSIRGMEGVAVKAVCDPDDAARERAREDFGAAAYSDARALFARETALDAVVCCAPPSVRLEALREAARRGLPVFIEKPPAMSMDEARAILELTRAAGSPVVVGFMWRHLRSVERAKEMLNGRTINHIRSEFFCPALTRWGVGGWFVLREKSGGPLVDQGIHLIDLIRHVAGDITEVATFGSNLERARSEDFTIEDTSSSILRFASGATGVHAHCWSHDPGDQGITFRTNSAKLTVHFDDRLTGHVDGNPVDEAHEGDGAVDCYAKEMRTFVEAVRSGDWSPPRSPYADAVKSLAVALAMNESMEKHQIIEVRTL